MERRLLDIRSSTCRGGGALWAFLSHVREIPRGGVLELLTDDEQARTDLPEWARHEGWRIVEQRSDGSDMSFALQRPWRKPRVQAR
ncbi:MAG: sulfurtransferase TusA family protein [Chloroflexi bacterium]|nr:sulfurtransferase TusA family protein [Chloroflexota bacterium]